MTSPIIHHIFIFLTVFLFFSSISFGVTIVVNASAGTCQGDISGSVGWGDAENSWPNVTIQDAIDYVNASDTIYVCKNDTSTYMENNIINKSISIYGNESGVIVNASNTVLPIFNISTDFVNISNFTLQDAVTTPAAGIYTNASHGNIFSINSTNNRFGFYLLNASNNTLTDNNAYGPNQVRGFLVTDTINSSFINNTAFNNSQHGFAIWDYSSNNIFINNTGHSNALQGFFLNSYADNNTLTNNTAYNNSNYGIAVDIFSSNNTFTNNTVHSNAQSGFLFFSDADNNTLISNTVYNHPVHGFYFHTSNGNNLSGNNASNNSQSQYFFSTANATFTDTNYAQNLPAAAVLINVTVNSIVTALVGTTYGTIVTDSLNFSFSNATNVTFQNTTADLSTSGISAIACQSTTTTCYVMSNILGITNNSGSANITQLLIYYNSSRISTDHYGTNDLQIARYNTSGGWTVVGSSEVASGYIRYGPVDLFEPFVAYAPVAFESAITGAADTTTTTDDNNDLALSYEVSGSTVEVTAASGSSGVSGVTIGLIYLDTGETIGDESTDSNGEATFTVTESGSYKLTDVDRPSGYLNAPDVTFEVTLEEEEEIPPPEEPQPEETPPEETPPEEVPPEEPPPEEVPPEEVPPEETPPEETPPPEEPEVVLEQPIVVEEEQDNLLCIISFLSILIILVILYLYFKKRKKGYRKIYNSLLI